MSTETEKVVVHLELSRKAAALLYALNQHALKLRAPADPEDEIDVLDAPDNFAATGVSETLRATFIGKHAEKPPLSFTMCCGLALSQPRFSQAATAAFFRS